MSQIEQQLYEFLEKVGTGEAVLSEADIEEFGERCKTALKQHLSEIQERKFTLRMSNIGRPLRQLLLDKQYGYAAPSPDFVLKMLYGSLYEALTILLLKSANLGLTELDKSVILKVCNTDIKGTLDVIINDKVYDVKTASPYSFEKKFVSWETLAASDDFGYMAQGFGYARAEGKKFGGWIVIHKVTGAVKVIEIPEHMHDELAAKYQTELEYIVDYVTTNKPIPDCDGVIEESYYKKPTGNKILGASCRFCPHKNKCHPEAKYLTSKASKSESPKYVWYVEINEKEQVNG